MAAHGTLWPSAAAAMTRFLRNCIRASIGAPRPDEGIHCDSSRFRHAPPPRPPRLSRMREHLELPRPLRLLRTALWSVTESAGLPVGAAALAAWLYGRDVGLLAGLVATWLTAIIRKIATGSVPSLLTISAAVLTMQTAIVLSTGQLWLYLLQFPVANLVMCVLFARTARGPSPLVARLAAEVVALRQPGHHPGLHRFFRARPGSGPGSSSCSRPASAC